MGPGAVITIASDARRPASPSSRVQKNPARRNPLSIRSCVGFTLIELLVVVAILAAVLGMVTLRLTRDDRDLVRDEADRLVILLQAAREDAILRGGLLAFEMRDNGYRFLQPDDKGKLVVMRDGSLVPREFPPNVKAQLHVDGQENLQRQGIILDPTGALPLFNIVFTLNDTRWWIHGTRDGKIRSLPTADANAK